MHSLKKKKTKKKYAKQWIPKKSTILDDLLKEQVKHLLDEWKETNQYAKKITNQAMHDEHAYKFIQSNVKKQKIQPLLNY